MLEKFLAHRRKHANCLCCLFDSEYAHRSGAADLSGIGEYRHGRPVLPENRPTGPGFLDRSWLAEWANFLNFANEMTQASGACRSARQFCYE